MTASPLVRPGAIGIVALLAMASPPPTHAATGLQSFIVALSDYTILDVTRAGQGVSVRWTQKTLLNEECGISAMRSYEVTLPQIAIDQLAGAPLCEISPRRVGRALDRSRLHYRLSTDGIPFGTFFDRIVATCDGQPHVFTFEGSPADRRPPVDPAKLRRVDPHVADVYELGNKIRERVQRLAPSTDVQESEGTEMATALRRGRYADIYADMCWDSNGRRTTCDPPYWQQVLANYDGPPVQRRPLDPIVRDRETLPFSTYVQPTFPPIARAARLFGDVKLRLTIQPDNGAVSDVSIVEGRQLLSPAARDAAVQWRFRPLAIADDQIDVTVSFVEGCPGQ